MGLFAAPPPKRAGALLHASVRHVHVRKEETVITDGAYADQVRWDAATFNANMDDHYGPDTQQVMDTIAAWLARGDGVAVYEDRDFSSPAMGEWKVTSYGSAAAQLETDQPPMRLPDGVGGEGAINWRFVLVGTYRATEEEKQ